MVARTQAVCVMGPELAQSGPNGDPMGPHGALGLRGDGGEEAPEPPIGYKNGGNGILTLGLGPF